MNYYEHHIGDYDQATAHLSAVEDGIYSRLIRWYMASESPLPADLKAVQRRVRAHGKDEREAVQAVLEEFFTLGADGYHQHRCDAEIERYKQKQAKAKASADARWSAQRTHSERNANASAMHDAEDMRTHSERNANGMHRAPVPRHQTPDTRHKEEEKAKEKAQRASALGVSDLVARGVNERVAADWLVIRKTRKAPLTETALQGVEREAQAARLSLGDAVQIAVERGWQGFKAAWLTGSGAAASASAAPLFPPGSPPRIDLGLTDEERASTRAALAQFA